MSKVTVIPPKEAEPEHLRVAAYCRVSSNSADQLHSYATQIRNYTELISKHEGWELVYVYADEGITGTRMDQRDEFNRMMSDCRKGRIDIKPRYLIQYRLQHSQRKCKNSGFRSGLSIRSRYFSFGGKLAHWK